jgi:hypothetical protein
MQTLVLHANQVIYPLARLRQSAVFSLVRAASADVEETCVAAAFLTRSFQPSPNVQIARRRLMAKKNKRLPKEEKLSPAPRNSFFPDERCNINRTQRYEDQTPCSTARPTSGTSKSDTGQSHG